MLSAVVVLALVSVGAYTPVVSAGSSVRCASTGGVPGTGYVNRTGVQGSLCTGVSPGFTTSSYSSPWQTLLVNVQPCNGNANTYTTSQPTLSGDFLEKQGVEATDDVLCSSNTAEVQNALGLHAASFTAWKSGSQTYLFTVNFTVNLYVADSVTYCNNYGASDTADASFQANVAGWDNTAGGTVGQNQNDYLYTNLESVYPVCSQGSTYSSYFFQGFLTTNSIPHGDVIVPRAGIIVTNWVNASPGYANCYNCQDHSSTDLNNDGYGYVVMNSIWVS